jgi:hypothetical protein
VLWRLGKFPTNGNHFILEYFENKIDSDQTVESQAGCEAAHTGITVKIAIIIINGKKIIRASDTKHAWGFI